MSGQNEVATLKSYPHHNMLNFCENRPKYRQGRKLTAVKVLRQISDHKYYNNKVYTVNDESQHLLIRGVPSVNLHDEVEQLCTRYGNVLNIRQVQFEDQEQFTHSFHVTYARLQSARFGKKQMDAKNFFGGILHVCYAPELETIEQTRFKLQARITEVTKHINKTGLNISHKKESTSEFVQHDSIISPHNSKTRDYNSCSQKQNRWLEGGLKCSYILPKSDSLNVINETVKEKSDVIKNSTQSDSKALRFVPRQLSKTTPVSKIKKPNRIIFHQRTNDT